MNSGMLAVLLSGAVTAAVSPLTIRLLLRNHLVDQANGRSSHSGQVPRGGGIALSIGIGIALVVTREVWQTDWRVQVGAACSLAFGILGLADDFRDLNAKGRLCMQGLIALGAAVLLLPPTSLLAVAAGGLVVAAIVGFVNAFNFMDGINGISVATTVVAGASLAIASMRWDSNIEVPALALVGAAIGFFPFNAAGRVFLGDVGSYLLGSALAGLAVIGVINGMPPLAALLPFALYASDVGFTLLRRLSRRQPLMQAHREHVYQRLANDRGLGHLTTTAIILALTAALGATAHIAADSEPMSLAAAVLAAAALLIGYLALPTISKRPVEMETRRTRGQRAVEQEIRT